MADYPSSAAGSVAASKQDAVELLLSTSRQMMKAASESSDTNVEAVTAAAAATSGAENAAGEDSETTPDASTVSPPPPPAAAAAAATPATFFPPPQAGRYYQDLSSSSSTGSGFLYLQQNTQQPLSKQSKLILQTLLKEHEVTLPPTDDRGGIRPWKKQKKRNTNPALMKTADSTMSDETILQLARQVPSQMSLLGSILQILDQSHPVPVSARTFLKTCALTIRPGLVPAHMDAKEMVLAALHFLSSGSGSSLLGANEYGLPYMRPAQPVRDLEKRVYEKVGDWTALSVRATVLQLEEDIFYEHANETLRWMPRCRFSPPIMTNIVEEDLLWLKGQVPAKPKQVRTSVTKKKTTTATTSKNKTINDTAAKEKKRLEEDPVAVEATRIMSQTPKPTNSPP